MPSNEPRKALRRELRKDAKLRAKVQRIFRRAFGDRVKRLQVFESFFAAADVIESAYRRRLRKAVADELSFHFSDWREDAAFVVAFHLFPEKFTPAEIRDGIERFACHAPYHVNGVAESLGYETKAPSECDDP